MQKLSRLDLNLLVALQALLEEKSVTKAAERLFISQPAMSRVLQRLRHQLDDPLFTRTGNELIPSPKARELHFKLPTLLDNILDLVDEGKFDPGKYVGEIKQGKPHGTGVLTHTFGKYSGEVKNGIPHGQGTYTYKSGRKRVGEFRKAKPWNVISYDKNGKIEDEWVEGTKLKKEETAPKVEKEHAEDINYEIGVRVLLGSTSGESSTSNTSLSIIWEHYGLGINQMSFKRTSSKNNVFEMNNSSLDLSYTLDLSYIIDWSATAGLGYVYEGKGAITSGSTAIKYETESVSGFGLFGLLGIEWQDLEGLIGFRYYSVDYVDFISSNTSEQLGIPYSISSAQLIFGLGYKF